MNIANSSSFNNSINLDGIQAFSLSVTIDSTDSWALTADSYDRALNGSLDNIMAAHIPDKCPKAVAKVSRKVTFVNHRRLSQDDL